MTFRLRYLVAAVLVVILIAVLWNPVKSIFSGNNGSVAAASRTPTATLSPVDQQVADGFKATAAVATFVAEQAAVQQTLEVVNPPATETPTPTETATAPAVQPTEPVVPTPQPSPTAGAVGAEPARPITITSASGQTLMVGFDLAEFGGDDSRCTRTELEAVSANEVVGSEAEPCKIVLEWSLKVGSETILAGVFPLEPRTWFYVYPGVAGVNDKIRLVGTLWYLPKNWNSHQFSADIARDRDARDGTNSIVGLSPTDPWVRWLTDELLGGRTPSWLP